MVDTVYLSVICACVSVRFCVNHGGTGTYHNLYTYTLTSNLTLTNPLMNSNQNQKLGHSDLIY